MQQDIGQVYEPNIQVPELGVYIPYGYDGQIGLATFSGDGKRVLTVLEVGTAKIWETESRILVGDISPTSSLTGMKDVTPAIGSTFIVFIEAAQLTKDGELALLGLNDGTAGLFSVTDGKRLFTFAEPGRNISGIVPINEVAFSADESLVAVGFFFRGVGVWDAHTGELVTFLTHPQGQRYMDDFMKERGTQVTAIAFSADRTHLFARCLDGVSFVWNYCTGELVYSAFNHRDEIRDLCKHSEYIRWATAGGFLWEARVGEEPRCILNSGETWEKVSFADDGQSVFAKTPDTFSRWTLAGLCTHPEKMAKPARAINRPISASGPALLYYSHFISNVGWDNKLLFYQDGEFVAELPTADHFDGHAFAVNWERYWAAVAESDYPENSNNNTGPSIAIYALPAGECIQRLPSTYGKPWAFSSDGAMLALLGKSACKTETTSGQQTVKECSAWTLVETEHWTARQVLTGIQDYPKLIGFGPRNAWFACFDRNICHVINLVDNPNWPVYKPVFIRRPGSLVASQILSHGRIVVVLKVNENYFLEMWRPPLPSDTPQQYSGTYLLYSRPLDITTFHAPVMRIVDNEQGMLFTSGRHSISYYNLTDGALLARYEVDTPVIEKIPDHQLELNDNLIDEQEYPFDDKRLRLCGERWSGCGGPYYITHGREFRKFGFMEFRTSDDRQYAIIARIPTYPVIINIGVSPNRVVATITLDGNFRAGRIIGKQVVIVDSLGNIYKATINE